MLSNIMALITHENLVNTTSVVSHSQQVSMGMMESRKAVFNIPPPLKNCKYDKVKIPAGVQR